MDAFSLDHKIIALFNTKAQWCSTCKAGVQWTNATWTVVINGTKFDGLVVLGDATGYTLAVEFAVGSFVDGDTLGFISLEEATDEYRFHYHPVRICSVGGMETDKYNLTACTSVQGIHKYQLPELVGFHIRQGYQQILISINDIPERLSSSCNPM